MDPVNVGVRLGSAAVAPLVKRLFRPRAPGAGLARAPVRIDELVSFRGEHRTLDERDLAKLASKLVERGLRALGPEGAGPREERAAIEVVVTRRLSALGRLDMDDVQAVALGADGLARALERADTTPGTRELTAGGQAFCDCQAREARKTWEREHAPDAVSGDVLEHSGTTQRLT